MKDTELMMIDNNSKESKIYSYENNLSEMIDILSKSFLKEIPAYNKSWLIRTELGLDNLV